MDFMSQVDISITVISVVTVLILVVGLLFSYKKWSSDQTLVTYTACSSPECIRCMKYNEVRQTAAAKLRQFEKLHRQQLGRLSDAFEEKAKLQDESQKPNVFYVPRLQGSPWWDVSSFRSDVSLLESNWRLIHDECLSVYSGEAMLEAEWSENRTESGCWQTFYFYNQGLAVSKNCSMCPQTYHILTELHSFMSGCIFGNALFSVLDPHTTVSEHYGPTNAKIRCHLGLSIPQGCSLTVKNETRHWTTGKCVVFDDSFIHSARHDGHNDEPRMILMLDFWHPDLSHMEKQAILYAFGVDAK